MPKKFKNTNEWIETEYRRIERGEDFISPTRLIEVVRAIMADLEKE